ncbi:hypothetical protein SAMN05443550_11292 [Pedobacter hartonius]|uniref:Uncharacterized protein n=1 Tax=Pedobacter hartonius TaxID=425514 RepID=A0A1H4H1T2_9SPHI|nr:hypothetical protein SAMN05443550_11292 [Pedobacter hartonius]
MVGKSSNCPRISVKMFDHTTGSLPVKYNQFGESFQFLNLLTEYLTHRMRNYANFENL